MRTFNDEELKIFKVICSMSQKKLHRAMKDVLQDLYGMNRIIDSEKYLYCRGTTPVLLVAHMDTVFRTPNREIFFDQERNVLWGGMDGLGADDRAGVFGIIWLLSSYDFRPHILLVEDEEIGGHGSIAAVKEGKIKPDEFRYVIELDRANEKDSVFYDCDNPNFEQYVNGFGFATALGSFTDISILCPAWGKAGVNLSTGYQNEHSLAETLIIHWLLETLDKVGLMLEEAPEAPDFEYIPSKVIPFGDVKCAKCGKPSSFLSSITIPARYTKKNKDMVLCIDCFPDITDYCETCREFYEVEVAGDKCPVCSRGEVQNFVR
jgi:hypothetical protein